jgi:hypothetical protein
MTLCIAAAICAAGFSQVEGPAGLYAALLGERYHDAGLAGFLERMAEAV